MLVEPYCNHISRTSLYPATEVVEPYLRIGVVDFMCVEHGAQLEQTVQDCACPAEEKMRHVCPTHIQEHPGVVKREGDHVTVDGACLCCSDIVWSRFTIYNLGETKIRGGRERNDRHTGRYSSMRSNHAGHMSQFIIDIERSSRRPGWQMIERRTTAADEES